MSRDPDEQEVLELAERIGYGRLMQLTEWLWDEKEPGGAHSRGPATSFLVPCGCVEHKPRWNETLPHCEWCCGCGRVTKRVREAMREIAEISE